MEIIERKKRELEDIERERIRR